MKFQTLIPLLLVLLGGCTQKPVPVPRQRAYPRIELYPSTYKTADIQGLTIMVNDSAQVKQLDNGWFDIIYPAYGITVNCTLSGYNAEIINNRMERIDRNLGGANARVVSLPGGIVVVAPTALRTPVQLLATDSLTRTLSGVAVSNFTPATDPDSAAPLIDAIAADMITLVKNL